jgi:pimeloyl-ACP methyl ester carboxylesterase
VLVGHDWGGAVAWAVAAAHPERVSHLVIMNAPHMDVFGELLATDAAQRAAFSYLDLFVQPGAEGVLAANDFAALRGMFEGVLSEEEMAAYVEAWGQERALEGGLNWYRANFADGLPVPHDPLVVDVPTTVLWGLDDTALLPTNLDGLPDYVADLRVVEVPGATHWIAHEVPDTVADEIRAALR